MRRILLILRYRLFVCSQVLGLPLISCARACSEKNIQSTNWNSVRFKPPPFGSQIGWRVEFRTMELQVTDFENAALTVFIALLSRCVRANPFRPKAVDFDNNEICLHFRVILYCDLNLYIPISKVDENFRRAHRNDAVRKKSFSLEIIWVRCFPMSSAGV